MSKFTIHIKYSNQDFDEKQQRAAELTQADREAGRIAPAYGYSAKNWEKACAEYKEAQQ